MRFELSAARRARRNRRLQQPVGLRRSESQAGRQKATCFKKGSEGAT